MKLCYVYLFIRSLHEPSISTVTSVRFVFRSSFKWFIIPILSFSLSLFLLSWRSNCIFLSSSWRKLIFSTNLELTSAKRKKINHSNFKNRRHSFTKQFIRVCFGISHRLEDKTVNKEETVSSISAIWSSRQAFFVNNSDLSAEKCH